MPGAVPGMPGGTRGPGAGFDRRPASGLVEQCYEDRLAPRPLAKLLVLQLVVIALVGAVTSAIT